MCATRKARTSSLLHSASRPCATAAALLGAGPRTDPKTPLTPNTSTSAGAGPRLVWKMPRVPRASTLIGVASSAGRLGVVSTGGLEADVGLAADFLLLDLKKRGDFFALGVAVPDVGVVLGSRA